MRWAADARKLLSGGTGPALLRRQVDYKWLGARNTAVSTWQLKNDTYFVELCFKFEQTLVKSRML